MLGGGLLIFRLGNVAIDVARVLCSRGESLQHTDITEQAVEALQKSRIENVSVVGRRGPAQSSFTNKELRELITKRSFPTISTRFSCYSCRLCAERGMWFSSS